MRRMGALNKGRRAQAEAIAAMILIPLFIVIFSTLVTSMFKTGVVGMSSIVSRTRFEQERALENLRAVWISGVCEISNTGPVDLEIVRVWRGGTSEPLRLKVKAGEKIPLDVYNIDLAVTSRGNRFYLKTMCIQSQEIETRIIYESGNPFTPENILNVSKLIGRDYKNKRIITRITLDGDSLGNVSVIYWNGSRWFINSGRGWVIDADVKYSFKDNELRYPDLDMNGVSEVTTTLVSGNSLQLIRLSKGGNYIVNMTFIGLLNVNENPSVIMIYFKFLADVGTTPSQQMSIGSAALLSSSGRSAFATGSTATASYKAPGSSTSVLVVTGSIAFPVQAYEPYKKAIQPGIYNLSLIFSINIPASSVTFNNIRIEYIAITGAELRWLP